MRELDSFHRNHLLTALIEAGCHRLQSQLELVPMTRDDVLYESDSRLCHAYFPTTSIVSLLSVMEDGASDEIAFVGNEGIVGVPLFMGGETTPNRAVVRTPGYAYKLKGRALQEEFNRSSGIQRLLLRYTQALLTQISQTAACIRYHSIHQQFCRWLLSSMDRLPSNEFWITHEAIAGLLGVRRESITKEAGELQTAGLIYNGRGRIIVVDRPRLEARACECYRGIRREFARLLSGSVTPAYSLGSDSALGRHLRVPPPGLARVEALPS
jgi:CRP-like cAMP-binding protein